MTRWLLVPLSLLIACGEDTVDPKETADTAPPALTCADATLSIDEVARSPEDYDGVEAILCGSFVEIEPEEYDCMPVGGDDPQLQEGGWATWEDASWGLTDEAQTIGVVPVDLNAVLQSDTLPADVVEGDELVLSGTLHYGTVPYACDLDVLFPSAWLEVAVEGL